MPRLLADRELLGDEGERDLGHVTPPMVNGQGVPATRDFAELRDRGIVLLQLVSSSDDRQRDRMVLLARDEQEGATRGVPGVDWSSLHRLRLAAATWKTGVPGP